MPSSEIEDWSIEMNTLLADKNIATREIKISDIVEVQLDEPIIVFTKEKRVPIIIYPKENLRSYFVNPNSGDHYIISRTMFPDIEDKAISFYRLLPKHKITFKDYLNTIDFLL